MIENILLTKFIIFLKFLIKFNFCRENCDLIYIFNVFAKTYIIKKEIKYRL